MEGEMEGKMTSGTLFSYSYRILTEYTVACF